MGGAAYSTKTGARYIKSDAPIEKPQYPETPTIKPWIEYRYAHLKPKDDAPAPQLTKESMKARLMQLKVKK